MAELCAWFDHIVAACLCVLHRLDDDEDEDEPLVSSNKTPTDAEIKKAIARIIKKTADLADLTKRKVIEAVKAQYPVAELDEKKTLMRETIGAEVAKRVAEDEESD